MKLILESRKPEGLIGLKVHQDGVKHVNFLIAKCNSLCEIEAKINLIVQLEERFETP